MLRTCHKPLSRCLDLDCQRASNRGQPDRYTKSKLGREGEGKRAVVVTGVSSRCHRAEEQDQEQEEQERQQQGHEEGAH